MRDILPTLRAWHADGERFALATVVATSQSAPRDPGASLAVHVDGEVVGSVSGGCVEGAVVEVGHQVLESGEPQLIEYGISDNEAFAVGLTCGGIINVFVEPIDPAVVVAQRPADQRPADQRPADQRPTDQRPSDDGDPGRDGLAGLGLRELGGSVDEQEPVAIATVIEGARAGAKLLVWPDRIAGTMGSEGLDVAVIDDARGMLEQGQTGIRRYGVDGQRRLDEVAVFVEAFAPPPRMYVFGAIDFAAAMARMGVFLGYHVTVCDARAVFATRARFPDAHEVVVDWPHRFLEKAPVDARTVICVLTHDPKFDVPVLQVALRTEAAYIGVMGSRRTHDDRIERLREVGVSEAELARMHSPIGLDLGARTPEETAVSIAAEIVLEHWDGTGAQLRDTSGRIHGETTDGRAKPAVTAYGDDAVPDERPAADAAGPAELAESASPRPT